MPPSRQSTPASNRTPPCSGDRPLQAFRRITLPLAAPGLATGLATAWARAMGAFGAVVIIAYYPVGLPNQIFIAFQEFGLPGALPVRTAARRRGAPPPAPRLPLERAHTRAGGRNRGAMSAASGVLLEIDLEVRTPPDHSRGGLSLEARRAPRDLRRPRARAKRRSSSPSPV